MQKLENAMWMVKCDYITKYSICAAYTCLSQLIYFFYMETCRLKPKWFAWLCWKRVMGAKNCIWWFNILLSKVYHFVFFLLWKFTILHWKLTKYVVQRCHLVKCSECMHHDKRAIIFSCYILWTIVMFGTFLLWMLENPYSIQGSIFYLSNGTQFLDLRETKNCGSNWKSMNHHSLALTLLSSKLKV